MFRATVQTSRLIGACGLLRYSYPTVDKMGISDIRLNANCVMNQTTTWPTHWCCTLNVQLRVQVCVHTLNCGWHPKQKRTPRCNLRAVKHGQMHVRSYMQHLRSVCALTLTHTLAAELLRDWCFLLHGSAGRGADLNRQAEKHAHAYSSILGASEACMRMCIHVSFPLRVPSHELPHVYAHRCQRWDPNLSFFHLAYACVQLLTGCNFKLMQNLDRMAPALQAQL